MQAIIIAAGESSRFWPLNNGIHKSQIKLFGKSLIYWTLKGLAERDIKNVVVVTGKDSSIQEMLKQENVRQLADGIKISYVVQDEALGAGNAPCLATCSPTARTVCAFTRVARPLRSAGPRAGCGRARNSRSQAIRRRAFM